MKKVMILGAGSGQLPFLNICKSKGYYVIVVSVEGNYPCFEKADKSYFVDTRNKEEILKIALAEKIDAIMTDQTDVSVPTVAYVAEKMKLRGIGYETALKFTDKYLMRQAARAAGVAVPDFYQPSSLAEAVDIAEQIDFPLIIKPVDSSGSRGVRLINSAEDLKQAYETARACSLSDKIILEKFIEGTGYCADGYAVENEHYNLVLGISEYFNLPKKYIPATRMFSSVKRINSRVEKIILEENKKLLNSMKLPFGITHSEYIYNDKEDKVYLIEIAARGGGNNISSDLITLASGFNANENFIDYVVNGNVHKVNFDSLNDKVSAYVDFGFPADGIVRNITGLEDLKNLRGIYKVHMDDFFTGMNVKELTDGSKRYGMILIVADDENECRKIIAEVKNILHVEIKTVDGIRKQIWGIDSINVSNTNPERGGAELFWYRKFYIINFYYTYKPSVERRKAFIMEKIGGEILWTIRQLICIAKFSAKIIPQNLRGNNQ